MELFSKRLSDLQTTLRSLSAEAEPIQEAKMSQGRVRIP